MTTNASGESADEIFARAAQRAQQIGLPYAGAVTPAEAQRLRADFDKSEELHEKLALGRNIESFLDRAADYDRRIAEK